MWNFRLKLCRELDILESKYVFWQIKYINQTVSKLPQTFPHIHVLVFVIIFGKQLLLYQYDDELKTKYDNPDSQNVV